MSLVTSSYSGIVINNNATRTTTSVPPIAQVFTLPSDYQRGGSLIPDLTGFQIFAQVTNAQTASITWTFDRITGTNPNPAAGVLSLPLLFPAPATTPIWTTMASGTTTKGTVNTGWVWFQVLFTDSLKFDPTWLTSQFRINITGVTAMTIGFTPNSMMYRVLAATADSGTDFLGNVYRSAIIESVVENVNTFQSSNVFANWMSHPCPSQFGVEALYLNVSRLGNSVVVDRVTIDPMTPGVYFHIYYSNDPNGPGIDTPSWENLLWTPVYKTYQANRMQTFALPEPVTAKYLCIEFTNLQARSYDPGNFQIPSTYKKYPQWVLDHFIAVFQNQQIDRISSRVNVTYDALDLAFSYHKSDIIQHPDKPVLSTLPVSQLNPFVNQQSALDPHTLRKISINFQPYLTQPALMGKSTSLISQYAVATPFKTYATEVINTAVGDTSFVSNLQREALLVEKGFPAMFFFIPCRHGFRIVQASFETNVAYFAGVKQLVVHRDVYTGYIDQAQYNENLGDGTNLMLNDYV